MFLTIAQDCLEYDELHVNFGRENAPSFPGIRDWVDRVDHHGFAEQKITSGDLVSDHIPDGSHRLPRETGSDHRSLNRVDPQVHRVQPGCQTASQRCLASTRPTRERDEHSLIHTSTVPVAIAASHDRIRGIDGPDPLRLGAAYMPHFVWMI